VSLSTLVRLPLRRMALVGGAALLALAPAGSAPATLLAYELVLSGATEGDDDNEVKKGTVPFDGLPDVIPDTVHLDRNGLVVTEMESSCGPGCRRISIWLDGQSVGPFPSSDPTPGGTLFTGNPGTPTNLVFFGLNALSWGPGEPLPIDLGDNQAIADFVATFEVLVTYAQGPPVVPSVTYADALFGDDTDTMDIDVQMDAAAFVGATDFHFSFEIPHAPEPGGGTLVAAAVVALALARGARRGGAG